MTPKAADTVLAKGFLHCFPFSCRIQDRYYRPSVQWRSNHLAVLALRQGRQAARGRQNEAAQCTQHENLKKNGAVNKLFCYNLVPLTKKTVEGEPVLGI
ncbi:unnamed protein product [Clavelina lepadiformis]|uniref:Uncharacterized protein n=1 Tax=Clavelina lepadiformis TaxID=159417 RepID=A0ABP0GKW6_CLALP